MAEKKNKKLINWRRLTLAQMVELVNETEGDPKIDLRKYKGQEYPYELVDKLDSQGKPITYIDKKGKARVKKKKHYLKDKEKKEVYNLLKAKRDFYEMYVDDFEWEKPPKAKKNKEKKESYDDILARLKK